MQKQYISLTDLRKVSGIGDKTIERIKAQLLQSELDSNYKSEYNTNIKLDVNEIHQGDCLELMNGILDKSVDMILCDLPYGTTQNSWDSVIDLDKLWLQYKRILKSGGLVVLFGSEPFSTTLRQSNLNWYRYDWIWVKNNSTGFQNANKQPMRKYEIISVFYEQQPTYNPQGLKECGEINTRKSFGKNWRSGTIGKNGEMNVNSYVQKYTNYPVNILEFNKEPNAHHPTQKPVGLLEYLIKTYTNEGDIVLDNCIGSGSTAISAINTNRNYIGIELDENYCNIAKNRINEHKSSILLK